MTRSRLLYGLTFIAFGTLLLLDQGGTLSAWAVIADWWPVVVIVAGLAQLVTRPRNVVNGAIIGLVGVALLLWTLRVIDTIALLWPILLIGLGLWLLLPRLGSRGGHVVTDRDVVVVLGERNVRAPAGPLEDRAVTAILADVDLDLRDTVIEDRATLQVTTILGDVDVEIPPTWDVRVSGPELLGDVTVEIPANLPATTPVLHVQILTVLGDLTVRGRAVAAPHPDGRLPPVSHRD